jgi:Tfp pilus assembly protein PilN
MKPIVFLFCEGTEAKLAVVDRDKNGVISVLGISSSFIEKSINNIGSSPSLPTTDIGVEFEESSYETVEVVNDDNNNVKIISLASAILQSGSKKADFVPILTEPNLIYHIHEGDIYEKKQDNLDTLRDEISKAKNIVAQKGSIDYVDMADDRLLATVIDGPVECLPLIKALSNYVGKDQPKINVLKSAEISLAYYVSKIKKFKIDEYSIIVYVGKEYSKLIFLKDGQITHIGSTLDVGTNNIHTYDVYFSKILLEMETGNIPVINNIVVCGEDISENLILSFYGTFPEAEINRLDFDVFDLSKLNETDRALISSYSIPLSAAIDYYDNLDKKYSGINLLPKQIIEERKFFQFSWHSLAILPLLFIVTVYFTVKILERRNELDLISKQIIEKEEIIRNNQTIIEQIQILENRIGSFGVITSKLDTLAVGRGLLTTVADRISEFTASKQNLWLTKIVWNDGKQFDIEGFSTSRNSITDFVNTIQGSALKNITSELLRDKRIYRFNLTIDISNYLRNNE